MQKTPSQQAIIQFIESIFVLALVAACIDTATAISPTGTINWMQVGTTFLIAFLGSAAHSLSAYLKALPAQNNQPGNGQLDFTALAPAINALLSPFIARLDALLAAQPAQNATQSSIAQPVRVSASTAVQPSTDGVQQPIAAFTATAEQPAVKVQ